MKNIATAFVKAQSAFGPALKTAVNGQFAKGGANAGKYAPLDACLDAVMKALNDNGVALIQQTHPCDDGVIVETLFIHESGETLSGGRLHVPADKQNAHGYGSALTYARRYSLMAACGIAGEDDDGNKAAEAPPQKKAGKAPEDDRTLIMKVRRSISDHLANGREMGANQEWELAIETSDEFAKAVWNGLTTPERDQLRDIRRETAAAAA